MEESEELFILQAPGSSSIVKWKYLGSELWERFEHKTKWSAQAKILHHNIVVIIYQDWIFQIFLVLVVLIFSLIN